MEPVNLREMSNYLILTTRGLVLSFTAGNGRLLSTAAGPLNIASHMHIDDLDGHPAVNGSGDVSFGGQ
jgi:hypothetical protein